MRRALRAIPTDAQIPWPSDPVATSTNGNRGVGWPSRSQEISRSSSSSERSNASASAHAAYKSGAAWPFESTKRSAPGCFGSLGSNRISAKKSAATRSAAEQQLVGWPLAASEVDLIESIRRRVAMFLRAGRRVARSIREGFRLWAKGQILFQIGAGSESSPTHDRSFDNAQEHPSIMLRTCRMRV